MFIPIPEDPSYTLLSIPVVVHEVPISSALTLPHLVSCLMSPSLAADPIATHYNHQLNMYPVSSP